jgi:hypothetical protein
MPDFVEILSMFKNYTFVGNSLKAICIKNALVRRKNKHNKWIEPKVRLTYN